MGTYTLTIITPNGKIFEDPIESLMAPGTEGSFGIFANHAPLIASVKDGLLTVKHEGSREQFTIGPGTLEVDDQHNVLLLCDRATPS